MFDGILDEKEKEKTFFYWHKDWLPFADDYSYDTLAIDTTGKITGRKGCVLQRSKDLFEEDAMSIIAPDFKTYIKDWVKRVEDEQIYEHSKSPKDNKNELIEEGEYYYEAIAQAYLKKVKKKTAKK
jgi:cell wall assembly regulator SMI1